MPLALIQMKVKAKQYKFIWINLHQFRQMKVRMVSSLRVQPQPGFCLPHESSHTESNIIIKVLTNIITIKATKKKVLCYFKKENNHFYRSSSSCLLLLIRVYLLPDPRPVEFHTLENLRLIFAPWHPNLIWKIVNFFV